MTNTTIAKFKDEANKTKDWLSAEFAKVRTGRATPSFLDSVQVSSYGSMLPLNQVGSVSAEDSRTLRISPWDTSLIPDIESAITKADLGVSTSSDEKGVRVHFPDLTAETRERIAKAAKQKHEEARVALRGSRDEARSEIQEGQKNNDLSEDEARKWLGEIEDITALMNKQFDELYENKRKELTTI